MRILIISLFVSIFLLILFFIIGASSFDDKNPVIAKIGNVAARYTVYSLLVYGVLGMILLGYGLLVIFIKYPGIVLGMILLGYGIVYLFLQI